MAHDERMEKKRKNVTVDDLAGMVEREFLAADKREQTRFDLVHERFDEVLVNLKTAKDDIVAAVGAIRDERIETLEKDVAALKKKVGIA